MIPRNRGQEPGTGSLLPHQLGGCIAIGRAKPGLAEPNQARLGLPELSRATRSGPMELLPTERWVRTPTGGPKAGK